MVVGHDERYDDVVKVLCYISIDIAHVFFLEVKFVCRGNLYCEVMEFVSYEVQVLVR